MAARAGPLRWLKVCGSVTTLILRRKRSRHRSIARRFWRADESNSDGLGVIVVAAGFERFFMVAGHGMRREGDDGECAVWRHRL